MGKCRSFQAPLAEVFAAAQDEDKPDVDKDLLESAYEEIRAAAEAMNCTLLEEIFAEMDDYRITGSDGDKWKRLKYAAEQFDYEAIIAILDE